MDYANLENVEVLAAGTWRGNKEVTLTPRDLDQMVANFKAGVIEPRLTLDHDDNFGDKVKQFLRVASLGFVSDLWRDGNKLIANFKEVPKKIAELIGGGTLKKRSAEFYDNDGVPYVADGVEYHNVLSGVSFFGADKPAVNSLSNDFEVLMLAYGQANEPTKVFEPITLKKESEMTIEELKKLNAKKSEVIAKFKKMALEADMADPSADPAMADISPDVTGTPTDSTMATIMKLIAQMESLCEMLQSAMGSQDELKSKSLVADKTEAALKAEVIELTKFKAEAEKLAKENLEKEAIAFVDEQVEEGRIHLKHRDMKIKDFLRAQSEGNDSLVMFKEDIADRPAKIALGEINDGIIKAGKEKEVVASSPVTFKTTADKDAAIEKIMKSEKISYGQAFDKLAKLESEARK